MPTVTNGSVEYSRNVKVADYENKALKVCWSFIVDDGEDRVAVTDKLTLELTALVHAKLGLTKATPAQEPAPAAQPPKQTRRKGAAAETEAATTQPSASSVPGSQPAEPAEITDKELTDLIQLKRTQHGVSGPRIRTLIGQFAERMSLIPQEKRLEFKTQLEALSKTGNDD